MKRLKFETRTGGGTVLCPPPTFFFPDFKDYTERVHLKGIWSFEQYQKNIINSFNACSLHAFVICKFNGKQRMATFAGDSFIDVNENWEDNTYIRRHVFFLFFYFFRLLWIVRKTNAIVSHRNTSIYIYVHINKITILFIQNMVQVLTMIFCKLVRFFIFLC